ncbi:hypothetical protein HDU99_010947 [Rhizoclosmatium hyalinum]|nr:hypothetical protein HDU99_010947 [Rhizoclosmatium hyalinum]
MSDKTNTRKYLVSATAPASQQPRWENDGLSKYPGGAASDPRSRLVGPAWAFVVQKAAADKAQDLSAAVEHVTANVKAANVRALLEAAGLGQAVKQQNYRFPGLIPLLTKLASNNLASDENLEILFGDATRVRGSMMEVGSNLAQSAPVGSPAHNLFSALGQQPNVLSARPKICSQCGVTSTQPGQELKECGGCHKVHYCGEFCQREAWPNHKPHCLEFRKLRDAAATRTSLTNLID